MTYEVDIYVYLSTNVSQQLSYKAVPIYTTQGLVLNLKQLLKEEMKFMKISDKNSYWQIVDAFKQQPNSFARVFYSGFYQCKGITLLPLKTEISKEDKVREKSIAESIIRLLPKTREKLIAAVV